MNTKLEIGFFLLSGLAFVMLVFWVVRTEKRLKRFFLGKKGKDLENTIEILENKISVLETSRDKLVKDTANIDTRVRKSIRNIQAIRFNPFPDQGGNQSFSLSMLNEEGDGVILSSLYARERTSVFAKPIKGGKPEHELSEEEKEVLQKAK